MDLRVNARGFTLIELLLVTAIIGILAAIIIAALGNVRSNAESARAATELKKLSEAAYFAKVSSGQTMYDITGSGCTDCTDCRSGADLRGSTGVCYTNWVSLLSLIETKGGGAYGIGRFDRDQWGSPYLLDENEGTAALCDDNLKSVGPNGIWESVGGVPGGDDIWIIIPNILPTC